MSRADDQFLRALREARGYLELAIDQKNAGADFEKMSQGALRALQRVGNDDDLIDQLYDEWADEQERFERMGYDE